MANKKQYQVQNQKVNNAKSTMTEEEFIAKLSTFGGYIQTIGGIMSTAASFMALKQYDEDVLLTELEEDKNGHSANDERISELEKQIQYLMKEIEALKGRKS